MEATPKQIEFARKLGIEKPENFTKEALREIIDQKVAQRPAEAPKTYQKDPESVKSYHLTDEQIRTNACELAFKALDVIDESKLDYWKLVFDFDIFLRTGKYPQHATQIKENVV